MLFIWINSYSQQICLSASKNITNTTVNNYQVIGNINNLNFGGSLSFGKFNDYPLFIFGYVLSNNVLNVKKLNTDISVGLQADLEVLYGNFNSLNIRTIFTIRTFILKDFGLQLNPTYIISRSNKRYVTNNYDINIGLFYRFPKQ